MGRLESKVAIITGAASGMGLSGATLFAREGATVIMTDVAKDALETEADTIGEQGGNVKAHVLDVSSQDSWAEVVNSVLAKYGRIDVLVNNAGIHMPKGILDAELDDWNKVLSVNLTGVWLGMKMVVPSMQKQGNGSIINISSIAALVGGDSDSGGAAYSAAKGGVRSLTKHVAQWFAKDGVRANSIHPGTIYTGLTEAAGITKDDLTSDEDQVRNVPLYPHFGDPDDIGYGMLYLASDESKYVTGEELVIDGGFTTR